MSEMQSARAGLEIDGRTAQAGQPGGILHGVCPVAIRVPQEIVRPPRCAAQHKKFAQLKYLCEQAPKIDKTAQLSAFWRFLPALQPCRLSCANIPAVVDSENPWLK